MSAYATITFELVKLVAQLLGALLVAWLAVRWALSRYKSEKIWERRLTAYSESILALSNMRKVINDAVDLWDQSCVDITYPENYQQSSRTIQEVISIARLILPNTTATRLYEYDLEFKDAANTYSGDARDILYPQLRAIENLIEFLVVDARATLGDFRTANA